MHPTEPKTTMCFCFLGLLGLLGAIPALASQAGPTEAPQTVMAFGLMGDQPYSPWFEQATTELIQHMNQDPEIDWIVHVGDIKGSTEPCSNALLQQRIDQLQRSTKPLVLVPGDNEWTDCHRPASGNFDPQERLEHLRQVAYSATSSLGRPHLQLLTQRDAGFPEHAMWTEAGTLFMTFNIPGSNNDLHNPPSRNTPPAKVLQLFQTRMAAVQAWFAQGRQVMSGPNAPRQTVVVIQGNPFEGSGAAWSHGPFTTRSGYAQFMAHLVQFMEDTRRPLLLAHGDTHRFRWDQPPLESFGASKAVSEQFHRVETWGHPFVNTWVKVRIKNGAKAPFDVEQVSLPLAPSGN
ncbi:MAG TPA: metallophosphoesterase [Limnobacter sp.]|nr:metallophosphoesterase [Limnobacter sp.]